MRGQKPVFSQSRTEDKETRFLEKIVAEEN